jgi:hypothetical protein
MERVEGIEPSYAAWKAAVLPLNYTRIGRRESYRANLPCQSTAVTLASNEFAAPHRRASN